MNTRNLCEVPIAGLGAGETNFVAEVNGELRRISVEEIRDPENAAEKEILDKTYKYTVADALTKCILKEVKW